MATIRRTYILGVCAISLQAVVWASIAFLRNLLVPSLGDDLSVIALQLAVIIIGLPIFLVHWFWYRNLLRQQPIEQDTALRWVYLYGLMAVFLLTAVTQLLMLVMEINRNLFGIASYDSWDAYQTLGEAILFHLIAVILLSAGWVVHWRMQKGDQITPRHAFTRRLYLYAFTTIGLIGTAVATFILLQWLLHQIGSSDWWGVDNLSIPAESSAGAIVFLTLWIGAWRQAQRLFKQGNPAEQTSTIRRFYLYAVLFVSVLMVVINATLILSGLFRRLLDLSPQGDIRDVSIGIFLGAISWLYHAYILHQDGQALTEQPQQANVRRIYWYLMAGVGLGAFLIGLGGDISIGIRSLAGHPFNTDLREQLAGFTSAIIAGLPVWLIPWRFIQRAIQQPEPIGDAERRAIVRKIYLYLYLFAATMTALISAIYIVAQLIELILGSRDADNLVSDMGQALAFIGIAIGVWVYHGRLLRHDNQQTDQHELTKLLGLQIIVAGSNALDRLVYEGLLTQQPRLQARYLPQLTDDSPQLLASADVIVSDWGSVQQMALTDYPAHKLIMPTSATNTDWLGVEMMSASTAVDQTMHALTQIANGEPVHTKQTSLTQIIGYAVAAFIGFNILMGLISFLMEVVF